MIKINVHYQKKRLIRFLSKSTCYIGVCLVWQGLLVQGVSPNSGGQNDSFLARLQRIFLPDAPSSEPPRDRTRAGGSRTEICIAPPNSPNLTALIPVDERIASDERLEATVGHALEFSTKPNVPLWFYVPYDSSVAEASGSGLVGELMLLDKDRNPIITEPIQYEIGNTPGFVRVELPPILNKEQDYTWYFSILCDQERPSRNPVVNGQARYINGSPQLESLLAEAPDQPAHLAYVDQGLWYQALDSVAISYRNSPNDEELQNAWSDFMMFLDLQPITNEPITNCCTENTP